MCQDLPKFQLGGGVGFYVLRMWRLIMQMGCRTPPKGGGGGGQYMWNKSIFKILIWLFKIIQLGATMIYTKWRNKSACCNRTAWNFSETWHSVFGTNNTYIPRYKGQLSALYVSIVSSACVGGLVNRRRLVLVYNKDGDRRTLLETEWRIEHFRTTHGCFDNH